LKDFGFCYFTTKSASDLEDYNKLKKKTQEYIRNCYPGKIKIKIVIVLM